MVILTVTMNPALDKIYFVDDYKVNQVFRPKKVIASAGGKGLNVARVAKLLGHKVGATGFIGGSTGIFIESNIKVLGIEDEFIRISGETRECINITDTKNSTSSEVLEPGPIITKQEITMFINTYKNLIKKYEIITLSGSLSQGIPKDFYRILIKEAKLQGKKILFDTSGEYLLEGIKQKPYLIKPNKDELSILNSQKNNNLKDVLLNLVEEGIIFPVITLGKDGCLTVINKEVYHFKAPKVEVINPVGSGDSFIAGCAVGLDLNYDLKDVLKLGMACGIANTQYTETGMVTKNIVDQYFEKITYHTI